ncbi:MAG: hypothetical protein V1793_17505 [Pseudomonadota bacterium]
MSRAINISNYISDVTTAVSLLSVLVALFFTTFKTPLGLALRMVGENPLAVEAQGLSVLFLRTLAVCSGSAMMAVGGAFLTLSAFDAKFDGVTANAAITLNLKNYGLEPGCNADMVVLQAGSRLEAIRLRPARLFVIRRGRVISRMPASAATLDLGCKEIKVDFCPQASQA